MCKTTQVIWGAVRKGPACSASHEPSRPPVDRPPPPPPPPGFNPIRPPACSPNYPLATNSTAMLRLTWQITRDQYLQNLTYNVTPLTSGRPAPSKGPGTGIKKGVSPDSAFTKHRVPGQDFAINT